MTENSRVLTSIVLLGVLALGAGVGQAQELLTNGTFEPVGGPLPEIPGWNLAESISGSPTLSVNSAVQQGFSNQPGPMEGEFGLWVRPWAGNVGSYTSQNRAVNAELSQTVAGVPEEMYTFTGYSLFQGNYAGGVDFLDLLSPSGEIESPTETTFELAFLDASDAVIGTPVTLDLRTEQFIDATWRQHTLMGMSPAGTAKVRVSAAMTDGLFNIDPEQSMYMDNFSLTGASAPATDLLANSNLNEQPDIPPEFDGWTVEELPEGENTVAEASFAQNRQSQGTNGVWVRGFVAGDAILSQMVEGVPGGDYTFSAWSAFEQFYTGGMSGTTTETFMELAFLDDQEQELETPLRINLLDEGQMNDADGAGLEADDWRQFAVDGIAPAGTAFVRVSAGAIGMVPGMENPQSAMFDDFSLMASVAGIDGDFNNNGAVENADLTLLLNNWAATVPPTPAGWVGGPLTAPAVDNDELTALLNNWGATAGSGAGSDFNGSAVPEPACWILVMFGLVSSGMLRRCCAPCRIVARGCSDE